MANWFDNLFDRFTNSIREAFLAVIGDVDDNVIMADITKRIEDGDVIGAFQATGLTDAAMRPITKQVEEAFETGGIVAGDQFPNRLNTPAGAMRFHFDVRDARAEAWLRDRSSTLITRISRDTQTNIRTLLYDGQVAGENPRKTAVKIVGSYDPVAKKRIGGVIGLTPQFERAVGRARVELGALDSTYFQRGRRDKRFDSFIRNAIASKTPLTQEYINKVATRYSDSLLLLRGENIARTETIAALNRAEWEAVSQAADMGAVNRQLTKRAWDNAGDARVRHDHDIMEGQEVGIDEPFIAPDGSRLMFPGDTSLGASAKETVNCRCRARLKVDWLGDIY